MTLYALRQAERDDEAQMWVEKRYRHADAGYYGETKSGWCVEVFASEWDHKLDPEAPELATFAPTLTDALVLAKQRWRHHPHRRQGVEPVFVKRHVVSTPEVFGD